MYAEAAFSAAPESRIHGSERTMTGEPTPLACGYLNPWSAPSNHEIMLLRRLMEAAAHSEGLVLGSIFVENVRQHPTIALDLLIELASRSRLTAVIVPSIESLARLPRVRDEVHKRLVRETGLRIIVALADPRVRATEAPTLRPRRNRPIIQRTGPSGRQS